MSRPAVAITLLLLALPGDLRGQFNLGAQGSWGDDSDFGVGARVSAILPKDLPPLEFILSFDVFAPDGEFGDYGELNGNVAYLIPVRSPNINPYAGVGWNQAFLDAEVPVVDLRGDTIAVNEVEDQDGGFNLLAGIKGRVNRITGFGELRYELGGGEQLVITTGLMVRFGPIREGHR